MKTKTSSDYQNTEGNFMRRHSRFSRTLKSGARLCCIAFLLVGAPAVSAATLDDAKAAGQVGEAPDGYVHLVDPGAPAGVKALVEDINAKRKAKYADIAKKRNAPIEAVAVQAGAKLVERTPTGQYVMDDRSNWKKK
jgi:uncharacterized protein YdbL (DUF1318 family)